MRTKILQCNGVIYSAILQQRISKLTVYIHAISELKWFNTYILWYTRMFYAHVVLKFTFDEKGTLLQSSFELILHQNE